MYLKRTGDYIDGCAMFWAGNHFEMLECSEVKYNRPGVSVLDRDNVGLVARFRAKGTKSRWVWSTVGL